jgi:hypothetical protein
MSIKFSVSVAAIPFLMLNIATIEAAVVQIDPEDLDTNTELDFQFEAQGNIDGLGEFIDSNGRYGTLVFGERLQGQELGFSDGAGDPIPPSTSDPIFDRLSGNPTIDDLRLVTGEPKQNLAVLPDASAKTNIIAGLGPLGFDSPNGRGEGSIAGIFSSVTTFEFGFSVFGANAAGSNRAVIEFFNYRGILLDTIELSPLIDGEVAFRADIGGDTGIDAFSIYNTDNGGLGYNNFRYNVFTPGTEIPVPIPLTLIAIGFAVLCFTLRSSCPCRARNSSCR